MIKLIETRDNSGCLSYEFYLNSARIPRSLTGETGRAAAERFKAGLESCEAQIQVTLTEYMERREWNFAQGKLGLKGKNWPVFKTMEDILDHVQKKTGIKNT